MSISEGIGSVIGALIACIIAAVLQVYFVSSIWWAALPLVGYLLGSKIGRSINKATK